MVTFKLIQLYPGSKPLGYILKPVNNGLTKSDNYYQNGIWFNPSDYPKYWQEVKELTLLEEKVVEKDYEILSVITNNNKFIEKVYNQDATIEPYWKIHSVKRLSDGEIFTIGDKVVTEYVNYTINKIDIVNDKCMVTALYDTNNPNGSRLHYNLNNLKKAKQPLFTTEDSVDIFEGDIFYIVDNWNIEEYKNYISINEYIHNLKFSTKEKAEEYILMNKPLLSLSDVWDNLKVKDQKEVMKFVKLKLNK